MSEANLAIPAAPAAAAPTAPALIKTYTAIDLAGNLVQVQAVVVTDEYGKLQPLQITEATAREMLAALISINNILFESTNCGAPITGTGTAGAPAMGQ